MSRMSCIGPLLPASSTSRTLFIHWSKFSSLLMPLYFQCAASPCSAMASIRLVRICTSTHLSCGPLTVMWSDSYPLDLGILIQSLWRDTLAV